MLLAGRLASGRGCAHSSARRLVLLPFACSAVSLIHGPRTRKGPPSPSLCTSRLDVLPTPLQHLYPSEPWSGPLHALGLSAPISIMKMGPRCLIVPEVLGMELMHAEHVLYH